jgi:MFS family permease
MLGLSSRFGTSSGEGGVPPSASPPRRTSSTRLSLLIALVLLINYVDRGNLATAVPLIQDTLHLTNKQLGVLLSAFFYTYVLAMVPLGWVAERYGAHRVLGAGVAVWSVATMLTGFAGGFGSILALRLLLGLGESVGFPSSSKLVAAAVEPARLGGANGLMAFGYSVGPAVGTVAGGLIMTSFGWRASFVVFGALSLLWLWPWSRVRVAPARSANAIPADVISTRAIPLATATANPSFKEILSQRGLWGTSIGLFASNYGFYFILAWLPDYLVKARGFSILSMAGLASAAYLVNGIAALASGWATDRWVASGRSAGLAYKATMVLNHLVSIAAMAGMALLPLRGCIACLFLYEIVLGVSSPGVYAISQIMAGPAAAGRWVGVQNCCGNFAGILAPSITGILIGTSSSFSSAFALAAVVNVLGVLGWAFIVPHVAPLKWQSTHEPAVESSSQVA